MLKIDGKKIAERLIGELRGRSAGCGKSLAAILVGDDEASHAFLARKAEVARRLGIRFDLYQLSVVISPEELEEKIRGLSHDTKVGGIVVQLPLPKRFEPEKVLSGLSPQKDIDALRENSPVESPAVGAVEVPF